MLTILIWLGSGFAFSAGLFIGIWTMAWRSGKQDVQNTLTSESLEELRRRNEIGVRQCEALERIAAAADLYYARGVNG